MDLWILDLSPYRGGRSTCAEIRPCGKWNETDYGIPTGFLRCQIGDDQLLRPHQTIADRSQTDRLRTRQVSFHLLVSSPNFEPPRYLSR